MGIAYAQHRQLYGQFSCTTSVAFRTGLDTILDSAGWTNKVAISKGWKYSLLSPQGLTAKVLIQDKEITIGPLNYSAITLQFMSADELTVGLEHHLIFNHPDYNALGYQVIVGQCQIFISLPGIDTGGWIGAYAHSFAGGIPRIPDGTAVDCTAETVGAISQCWWSCGSGDEAFGPTFNLRDNLWCKGYYSYNVNGAVLVGTPPGTEGPQSNSLQIYTFKPTYNTEIGSVPLTVQYGMGVGLKIDPMIGWESYIRGQVWDGFLITAANAIDALQVTQEPDTEGNSLNTTWKCYSATPYGSLWLRISDFTPATDGGWNYAY